MTRPITQVGMDHRYAVGMQDNQSLWYNRSKDCGSRNLAIRHLASAYTQALMVNQVNAQTAKLIQIRTIIHYIKPKVELPTYTPNPTNTMTTAKTVEALRVFMSELHSAYYSYPDFMEGPRVREATERLFAHAMQCLIQLDFRAAARITPLPPWKEYVKDKPLPRVPSRMMERKGWYRQHQHIIDSYLREEITLSDYKKLMAAEAQDLDE